MVTGSSITTAAPTGNTKAALYIEGSTAGVTSTDNTYRYCYFSEDAAIYHLVDTKIVDNKSRYHDNAGAYGGVFYTEKTTNIEIIGDPLETTTPYF